MPDFRRPPEWQQPADRHSQLVDPVLTVRQLSRFEFSRKALTRIDHALVFSTPKGSYDTYLPPQRPSRGEVAARGYTAVYEVDMGVHHVSTDVGLPSDNDAFEFGAAVDLSWQVVNPGHFVESGHRDVPALLLGELQLAVRPVTRRFSIERSAEAEQELLAAAAAFGPLGASCGLQVTWTLRLRRDQENIDHQRRLQAIDHASAEQIRTAQRGMEYDVELDRRGRQQDSLQTERALEYGRQQQELLLQQQRWQHEQAMLQSRQQIELQRIEAEKIEFYQYYLQQGGVQAWALHLAQHPEDSQLVMTSMRDDQLRLIQDQMDLVKELLSGDNAENYELEGPKQLALRTVSDILNQRLPGVPQSPPPPQGPPPPLDQQPTPPSPPPAPAPLPGWQPPAGYGTTPAPPPAPPGYGTTPTAPTPPAPPEYGTAPTAPTPPTAPPPPAAYGTPPIPPPPPGYGTTPTPPPPPVSDGPTDEKPPEQGPTG